MTNNDELQIDTSTHQPIPTTRERLTHALLAILLGFLLANIIGFWMFPGVGLGGLYMFSQAHSVVEFIADLTNVVVVAFLAICAVFGWFQGKYFIDRLAGYLDWWKFW